MSMSEMEICQVTSTSTINGNGEGHLPRRPGQLTPFVTRVKVVNIGSTRRKVITERRLGFVSLTGAVEEKTGKSSFILSLMLGLGYDLLPQSGLVQSTMCGLYLDRAVRIGSKQGYIELTMSLQSYPSLEQEYGSHMKFVRVFKEENSLSSSSIILSSADPIISSAIESHRVQSTELERIYEQMNLSVDSFRLMFLNSESVDYLLENPALWYSFIEAAVGSEISADVKLKEMNYLIERLRNTEKRKQMASDSLREQLRMHVDIPGQTESEEVRAAKRDDTAEFKRCMSELVVTFRERREQEAKRDDYTRELSSGFMEACVTRMLFVFNEFLEQVHLSGHIMIQHEPKKVAFCAWDLNDLDQEIWAEFKDVENRWMDMSRGKKFLAMLGFYVSLWEVSNYLPLFVADAFSTTWGEFMIPPGALPVLQRVLDKKVKEGKQCFVSQPPPIHPTSTSSNGDRQPASSSTSSSHSESSNM